MFLSARLYTKMLPCCIVATVAAGAVAAEPSKAEQVLTTIGTLVQCRGANGASLMMNNLMMTASVLQGESDQASAMEQTSKRLEAKDTFYQELITAHKAKLNTLGVAAEAANEAERTLFRKSINDMSVALLVSAKTGAAAVLEYMVALKSITEQCDNAIQDNL